MQKQKIQEKQCLSFDPQHSAMPHDIKLDFYGRLLATCSSQGRVNIFRIEPSDQNLSPKLIATANRHKGPVYQVQWSPPNQSCLLASCGDDGQLIVHKVFEQDVKLAYSHKFQFPVTSIGWCGIEGELVLAAITNNQQLIFAKCINDSWTETKKPRVLMPDSASASEPPEIPAFLSWSPPSQDEAYLLVAQNQIAIVFKYNHKAGYGETTLERMRSSKFDKKEIRDVTWEQCIGNQIRRPMILLQDRVVVFSDLKLDKHEEVTLLQRSNFSFAIKFGWSDSGTRLNVYCLQASTFVTKTLKCSFNGVWELAN